MVLSDYERYMMLAVLSVLTIHHLEFLKIFLETPNVCYAWLLYSKLSISFSHPLFVDMIGI